MEYNKIEFNPLPCIKERKTMIHMFTRFYIIFIFSTFFLFVRCSSAQDTQDFDVFWDNGLKFQTPNKEFQMQLGGRIQNDWAFFLDDAFGEDGVEFRRARLFVKGLLYEHLEFKTQYDFASGDGEFKDVYLGLVGIDYLGGLRIGHFKEPFGLEQLTSSKYITFLERSLPDMFSPGRNTGLMVHNSYLEERLTYALALFRETDEFGSDFGED
ncbi:hypothetical protein GF373_10655, partial [bacterium]|nr:hypothetical protein [bacterium]